MDKILVRKNNLQFTVVNTGKAPHEFWQKVIDGRWEPETFGIFDRFLNPRQTYLDVGAWIGPTLLYACQKAKMAYGIEPDTTAFRQLTDNIDANPSLKNRLKITQAALVPRNGSVNLFIYGRAGDSCSSLIAPSDTRNGYQSVRGISLPTLIKELQIADLGFIKMDIEGGEYSLIPAIAPLLQLNRPVLYLSLHPGNALNNFWSPLQRRSPLLYRILRVFPLRRLTDFLLARFAMAHLLYPLRFYRYCYSKDGRPLNRFQACIIPRQVWLDSLVFTSASW